jgi:hypothetical protein
MYIVLFTICSYIYISRTQIRKSDSLLATLRLPSCQSSQDIPTSQLKGAQATPILKQHQCFLAVSPPARSSWDKQSSTQIKSPLSKEQEQIKCLKTAIIYIYMYIQCIVILIYHCIYDIYHIQI